MLRKAARHQHRLQIHCYALKNLKRRLEEVQESFTKMVSVCGHGQEGTHSHLLTRTGLRTSVDDTAIVIRLKARKVIRLCNITMALPTSCTGGLHTGHGGVVMNFQQLDQRGRLPLHLQRDQQRGRQSRHHLHQPLYQLGNLH